MSEWIESRYLHWADLMDLCIRQHWYTCGSNEDYEKLRARLYDGKGDLGTDAIIAIAKDIAAHSVGNWTVEEIACEIVRICRIHFSFLELP